ncbi:MAG TPA: hypothetical protein VK463_07655 [Desulfomonilaceae bacterium]|nr:hypothetical protein [Desulfomonilaceae bacterium]
MSDDAQDARQLFDAVSILCSIFFGIPLGIILLKIAQNMSDPISAAAYRHLEFPKDVMYTAILIACICIPMLFSYLWYEKKLHHE